MLLLESLDVGKELQREGRIVEPLDETELSRRVDLEGIGLSIRPAYLLGFEVHRHGRPGHRVQTAADGADVFGGQDHRQQAVTETVAEENLAEARRNDAS